MPIVSRKRSERVSDLIKKEISFILLKEVKDPRIGFVTITMVEVSDDLRLAKVFYSVMGSDKEIRDTTIAMENASGFIKKKLGEKIRMRYLPDLVFKYDHSLEHGARISDILKKLKNT